MCFQLYDFFLLLFLYIDIFFLNLGILDSPSFGVGKVLILKHFYLNPLPAGEIGVGEISGQLEEIVEKLWL